jgi:hypothetical protein
VLGAGAVAVERLRGGRTYVGVPARELGARARAEHALPSLRKSTETNSLARFLR